MSFSLLVSKPDVVRRAMVRSGLENFLASPPESVTGRRMGLLCNPASVDSRYRHGRVLIDRRFPGRLAALFSPQHGFFGEKQDNMIESEHMTDPVLKIPVCSLYGEVRKPTQDMLASIDILLVDLQDVGTRVYTFTSTLSLCMEAAAQQGKRVVVLDRPNPVGGETTEGNCLSPECVSFVGRYPIPMRHGLTIGELARMFNEAYGIGCRLEIVPMTGWKRRMVFNDTGLPWVPPSPNLPTPASATVYPGQVVWEGTNVSEGRGTCQPFEIFGAPYLDTRRIRSELGAEFPPGAVLRPVAFEPTANKWQHRLCFGFQIHVLAPRSYRPYRTTLKLLQLLCEQHGDRLEWKPPPYEYNDDMLPLDLIIGDKEIRQRIERMEDLEDIVKSWQDDLGRFNRLSRRFHLYG